MNESALGIYEHYKGGVYIVLMECVDATNGRDGDKMIVYRSLENGGTYVRRKEEFFSKVESMRPRFKRLRQSPVLEEL